MSAATSIPWIADLNALDEAAAVAALAPLFEGAPRFLRRLVAERPFWTWERLFESARELAHGMPQPEQVELLAAHPRLGADPGSVSAQSRREQGHAGVPAGAPAPGSLAAALLRLNEGYERRFGFRYCVFVAGRPLAKLVPELEASLGGERDAELHRGLDAVVDIARARQVALSETEGTS